jgi:hypothetical protein
VLKEKNEMNVDGFHEEFEVWFFKNLNMFSG